MNYKKLLFFTILPVCFLLSFGNQCALGQVSDSKQVFEDIYDHWFNALDQFQSDKGISKQEYATFSQFSAKSLDSLRADFIEKIGDKKVTLAGVKDYEGVLVQGLNAIYSKFERIKQLYPSSVDEYKNYPAPMLSQNCDSACTNIDFESGDLSGWYAYYGVNESNTSTNISNITGGLAGAVTHAANDVLTSTPGFYNPSIGPNPSPDYQVNITSGSRGDGIVPTVPVVSPFGGHYSVMLGDSTLPNYGTAILSQTFKVTSNNANFTYQYAVFLENPVGHTHYQQPFFKVAVLDQAGDTIPFCGEYYVVSSGGIPGFKGVYYLPNADTVYYKDWTMVNVPLKRYIGQCVTVIFEVADCALGGHFGYAYVDASCAPLTILSSSYVFCGQDSITLTGPAGESRYKWTGPTNGIISGDTSRNVTIDSVGTYTVIATPFTGASCNDTLTITIGKRAGPPPHPDFTGDTVCVGAVTTFTNTSNPIGGNSFYWDFYNLGTYEDSTVNANWRYNIPGTYTVKLEELMPNGCGMDTLIKVVVDSDITPAFITDTICARDTEFFANSSTGATSFQWNFGDPSSGINNTSVIANPYHVYNVPGTYVVTLNDKNSGCAGSITKSVVVLAPLHIKISGADSVCTGSPETITVSGGTSYLWSNGATTSSITVNPANTTTYTVRATNGRCYLDSTFTIYIKPVATGTLSGTGTICFGDTIVLDATGGGTYLWNTGATTSSISVPANSFKDTAYSVIIKNGKSCITIRKRINIDSLYGYACCNDTIFSGDTVVLIGSGASKYYWIPPTGLSCDTCPNPLASPTVTTTYTLITTSSSGCSLSSAITVDVEIPCKDFFIPNVFTPNGDGTNDTYLIKTEFMSDYEISIYNRWGKEVFHSTDPSAPWDGNIGGLPASEGVYYYIIKATCINGKYFHKQGFLQLIRNNK